MSMAENADRKRKKSAYFAKCAAKKSKTSFTLQSGQKGFIATCNYREKDCVREAINILSEFADKLYGEDKSTASDVQPKNKKIVFKDSDSEDDGKSDEDIESALAREVGALKQERQNDPSKRRFQVIESGAANCVFIRSMVEDPVLVVETIVKEIESLAKQKTRFLLRLIPIEVTCKAWPEDIKAALGPILDKYFKGDPKTFCVVFKRRNNNNVLREELIHEIASEIKLRSPLHRADMKQPDLAVIVEVIRNICCMSVVPKYFYYRKYNLIEVAKMKVSDNQSAMLVKNETTSIDSSTTSNLSLEKSASSTKVRSQPDLEGQAKSEPVDVDGKSNPDEGYVDLDSVVDEDHAIHGTISNAEAEVKLSANTSLAVDSAVS